MIYAVFCYHQFNDGSRSAYNREGNFADADSPEGACRRCKMDPADCRVEIASASDKPEIVWTGERFREVSLCST